MTCFPGIFSEYKYAIRILIRFSITIQIEIKLKPFQIFSGVGRRPKTCFHSLTSLLNRGLETPRGPACISETPKLAEMMYQLIYFLCAHPETGAPSQRYLRANHDFFVSHTSCLPFVREEFLKDANNEMFITLSNQQSWLLKTIAIEVKMASQTRLRSSIVRILAVLFGQQSSLANGPSETMAWLNQSQVSGNISGLISGPTGRAARGSSTDGARNLVSLILSDLELTQEYPTPLITNMFDIAAIEHIISSCEEKSEETGVIICDVKMLHRVIMGELNSTQGMAAMGQRPEILKVGCFLNLVALN